MLGELSNLVTHRFSGRIGRTDRRGCAQLLLESGSAFLLNVRALLWLQAILAGLQSQVSLTLMSVLTISSVFNLHFPNVLV